MAQSLLVQSKQSSVRVSDQFAEIAKIKGSAEENIQRANAQAAQLQANAKINSTEKWRNVTDKLSTLFANKATDGRIEAGKKTGQELVKKAIETNTFIPTYKSDKKFGFGKTKLHDEEANKRIEAYNNNLLVNTFNTAYDTANTAAVAPESMQDAATNLQGVYSGIIAELEELGNDELVINAKFLASQKLGELTKNIAKRQQALIAEKTTGGFFTELESAATPTTIEGWRQRKALREMNGEEIANTTGSNPIYSRGAQAIIKANDTKAFNLISQNNVSGAIDEIVPKLNEQIDPTTPFVLTDDNIKLVGDTLANAEKSFVETATEMGIQIGTEEVEEFRNSILSASAELHYKNSINLEERGLMAGGKYDTQLVEDIMAEETARGELVISEMAGFISDPVERSEFIDAANTKLHGHISDKKQSLSTYTAQKENDRLAALEAPVKSSLMPASNIFANTKPEDLPKLSDPEFKHFAIYDISGFLYGQQSGLKPAEGEYERFIVGRMNELGLKAGSREFKEYRAMAWKRYNSTIAPFSEQARANGYKRKQTSVGVPQMDGDNVLFDDSGNMKMTSIVLDENSIITLSKNPASLEETMISIQANPQANEHFVDLLRQRNNQVPFAPNSNLGKMAYAGIAGIPFTEEMQGVNVRRNTAFAQSIADSTGMPMLDSQSYYFLRNYGNRSDVKTDATESASTYIDYTDLDKIELGTSFSKHGIFLPLTGEFKPATSEDFNKVYGDDFDSITDILANDPRAIMSSGEIDDETAEFIKDNFDKWSFLGMGEFGESGIKVVPIKHENGFSTIHYRLYDVENKTQLPGVYTIDLSGMGR